MADEIILPEAITKDMLQALFTDAYMDVSLDSDGDIVTKQSYRAYVVPATDGRFIRLYSLFKANPDATPENKLAFVNKVNDELIIVRAYVTDNGGYGFEWYIPIDGGVTKKLIVLAVQRFHRMLDSAIAKDDKNVVG